ncbi:MAG: SDR family oxidoreductase, partial [Myxococcota bacterium]|nr:SDR family oxidoreductase [Myxococcota bacterium]
MTETRPWLLVLGASSGFGAATARVFAEHGFNVAGVHLDRRGRQAEVDELVEQLRGLGAEVRFYNRNAADDATRREIIEDLGAVLHETGSRIQVVLHSLAF